MPKCIVPGCTSGYSSNPEKVHFFTIPKNVDSEKLWKSAVRREDVKAGAALCQKHFRSDEILWQREFLGPNGKVIGVGKYRVPRLKKGCFPTIFPWVEEANEPPCETSNHNQKDQELSAVEINLEVCSSSIIVCTDTIEVVPPCPPPCENLLLRHKDKAQTSFDGKCASLLSDAEHMHQKLVEGENIVPLASAEICDKKEDMLNFQKLQESSVGLSPGWIKYESGCAGKRLLFFLINETMEIDNSFQMFSSKNIMIKENMSINVRIFGLLLNLHDFDMPSCITCIEELESLVSTIHRLNVCQGVIHQSMVSEKSDFAIKRPLLQDIVGTQRHNNCPLLLRNAKICMHCSTARNSLRRSRRKFRQGQNETTTQGKKILGLQEQRRSLLLLRAKYRSALKAKRLAREKIKTLQSEVTFIRRKIAHYDSNDLEQHVQNGNIPQNQLHVLNQIIEAAKHKSSRGRNYSEQFMLLCMLLHMRSPSGYEFLRSNEILPLPSLRTVRRYLSRIKSSCGFDREFFEVLKLAFSKKSEIEKLGILLLDEISTRESVNINTKNLTYTGLIDFGEEGPKSSNFSEKANHGLVFMFQSLHSYSCQPIAVFASRGPVKGEVLAQLIMKALIMSENIGVKIHGVVSDGASPNRKFWSELGVSGEKGKLRNYFEHPVVEGRKVFVFSDTPHLLKTVRNRWHNKKVLQMDPLGQLIKWEHIEILYKKDRESAGPGQTLVCPKLSSNHISLNNSLKMRVRLAAQVLSNSVAGGLRFFERFVPELRGCEATAGFCEWMNDIFDALNRKDPIDGVQPGNVDFKKMQAALQQLDTWEEQVEKGHISKDLFLTKQTAEGLRVTLKSMLDLVEYLTGHCNFPYVSTGLVNQDALEVCLQRATKPFVRTLRTIEDVVPHKEEEEEERHLITRAISRGFTT